MVICQTKGKNYKLKEKLMLASQVHYYNFKRLVSILFNSLPGWLILDSTLCILGLQMYLVVHFGLIFKLLETSFEMSQSVNNQVSSFCPKNLNKLNEELRLCNSKLHVGFQVRSSLLKPTHGFNYWSAPILDTVWDNNLDKNWFVMECRYPLCV